MLRPLRGLGVRRVFASVLALVIGLIVWPTRAAAQSEPHGFVEPCTIGNVQEMYTQCELCEVRATAPQACVEQFGKRGYEKKCRTHGDANGFGEVWCIDMRKAQEAPPAEPRATPKMSTLLAIPVLTAVLWLIKRLLTRRGDRLLK